MEENKKNQQPGAGQGQQGNQNWDDQNDQRSGGSRQPNPERLDTEETSSGQEGNQNWDDQNDKRSGTPHKPNPERSGSGFNEDSQKAGFENPREEKPDVEEKGNQTGPGLG